jgi:catechol 2,3-dioxygenase-like lactoylglutathione lyase family enzyme
VLRMTSTPAVNDLVAYAHVADVQRSIDFYAFLGFKATEVTLDDDGVTVWALLVSGSGRLMVSQASEEIEPRAQAILFYLFTPDVAALREKLEREGVPVGEIDHPEYMPSGVFRVEDPDGYVLLIAQR